MSTPNVNKLRSTFISGQLANLDKLSYVFTVACCVQSHYPKVRGGFQVRRQVRCAEIYRSGFRRDISHFIKTK